MNTQIVELGKKFVELKKKSDALTKEVAAVNAEWTQVETELQEAMIEEGVKSIKLDGMGTFTLRTTPFLSVTAENKERYFEYLRKIGEDSILKLDVNPRTNGAFLKAHLESRIANLVAKNTDLDEVTARKEILEELALVGVSYFTKRDIALKGE